MEKVLGVVRVTWLDSQSIDEWEEVDAEGNMLCETIGYLVAATDDRIVIAPTRDLATENVCGQLAIPRGAVQSITWLKE